MWSIVSLWLWSAAAGQLVPRPNAERLVRAAAEAVHVYAARVPAQLEGIERLPRGNARERWSPAAPPAAIPARAVAITGADLDRPGVVAARDIAPRPRRSVVRYDATAPPATL